MAAASRRGRLPLSSCGVLVVLITTLVGEAGEARVSSALFFWGEGALGAVWRPCKVHY